MARKRLIRVVKEEMEEEVKEEVGEPEEEIPEKYRDLGWKHWLRNAYAKVWYVLLCLLLDAIVPLELARLLPEHSPALPLLSLVALIPLQMFLYHRLWGGLEFLFDR